MLPTPHTHACAHKHITPQLAQPQVLDIPLTSRSRRVWAAGMHRQHYKHYRRHIRTHQGCVSGQALTAPHTLHTSSSLCGRANAAGTDTGRGSCLAARDTDLPTLSATTYRPPTQPATIPVAAKCCCIVDTWNDSCPPAHSCSYDIRMPQPRHPPWMAAATTTPACLDGLGSAPRALQACEADGACTASVALFAAMPAECSKVPPLLRPQFLLLLSLSLPAKPKNAATARRNPPDFRALLSTLLSAMPAAAAAGAAPLALPLAAAEGAAALPLLTAPLLLGTLLPSALPEVLPTPAAPLAAPLAATAAAGAATLALLLLLLLLIGDQVVRARQTSCSFSLLRKKCRNCCLQPLPSTASERGWPKQSIWSPAVHSALKSIST